MAVPPKPAQSNSIYAEPGPISGAAPAMSSYPDVSRRMTDEDLQPPAYVRNARPRSFWQDTYKPMFRAGFNASPPGMAYNWLTGNRQALAEGAEDVGGYFTQNLPDAGKATVNAVAMKDVLERDPRMAADPLQNAAGISGAIGAHALLAGLTGGQGNAALASQAGRGGAWGARNLLTRGVPSLASQTASMPARVGSELLRTGVNVGTAALNPVPLWTTTRVAATPFTGSGAGGALLNTGVRALGTAGFVQGVDAGVRSPYQYYQDNPDASLGRLALEAAKGPLSNTGFVPLPGTSDVTQAGSQLSRALSGETARLERWNKLLDARWGREGVEGPFGASVYPTVEQQRETQARLAAAEAENTRNVSPVGYYASRLLGIPSFANVTGRSLGLVPYSDRRQEALADRAISEANDRIVQEHLLNLNRPLTSEESAALEKIQQNQFLESLRRTSEGG